MCGSKGIARMERLLPDRRKSVASVRIRVPFMQLFKIFQRLFGSRNAVSFKERSQ